jgi:iron complex outermembrane receptor protein
MYSPIVMTPIGFATLPIDFSIHEPSLHPIQSRDHTGFLTVGHQFNANWQLTVRGAFMRNDNEGAYMWVTGVNTANPTVLLCNPKYDLNRTEVFSEQAFVNGKFTTGGLKHQLLAGVDVNQKRFRADSYVQYDTYTDAQGKTQLRYYPLDINNPVYGTEIPNYHTPGGLINRNTTQTVNYRSFYALDELALFANKLRLTLGLRYTSVQTRNDVSGVTTTSSDNVATPRLGISYSLRPDLSVYALYDRTLVPQAGITIGGDAIRPLQGTNREIGIKKNWLNGRWNTTLAFYRINRSNAIANDPNNSLYRIQVGANHAQGIDFDVVGQVARGLNAVINYAYTDAKIDNDVNTALIGTPTPMYVKHIQNTWLNYELPSTTVPGLTLSLGYQYQGGRGERYATATQHVIPDFFRLDGGIGWQIQTGQTHAGQRHSFKVNLLVNNLLNKTLIATAWYRNGLYYWVPQAPVSGRLSVSYTF